MMRDNKGFSLIELVVVIAIMAVLVGMVSLGLGTILGLEAQECVKDMDGYLKQAKTDALSREGQKLSFSQDITDRMYYASFSTQKWTKDGSGNIISDVEIVSKEKIASDKVTIRCKLTDGTEYTLGTNISSFAISFNRSTGAYENVFIDGIEKMGKKCIEITVSKGTKSYSITLIPETGKHFIQ